MKSQPSKASAPAIVNKYWKLIRLNGEEISMAIHQEREQFFILRMDGNKVSGFAGCNNFSGTFSLGKKREIKFSQMLATMMACQDLAEREQDFLKVFSVAKSYVVVGDTLWLRGGRTSPIARFEAVYFH